MLLFLKISHSNIRCTMLCFYNNTVKRGLLLVQVLRIDNSIIKYTLLLLSVHSNSKKTNATRISVLAAFVCSQNRAGKAEPCISLQLEIVGLPIFLAVYQNINVMKGIRTTFGFRMASLITAIRNAMPVLNI